MAIVSDKTSKVTLKVDLTSETTKNITLNYINPLCADSVVGSNMIALAGLQSHSLNTLTREQKYAVTED